MAKVKMGSWEYTERELESMFDEATIRGKLASKVEPQAESAHYDRPTNRVVVELKNGATFIFPCKLAQGLNRASADDLALVQLGPRGASLHWEKLDVDFSIVGLMSGVFGNKLWMAKLERNGAGGKRKRLVSGPRRARPVQDLQETARRSKTEKHPRQSKAQERT